MKKILLFGATGMAGHVIYYYLKESGLYDLTNVVYRNKLTDDSIVLDVTQADNVSQIIYDLHPDIIINCIGILIKGSKTHPYNAILINACFPHLLKKLSDDIGAKLIHISTDCVFSGKKGNYDEYDYRDADDIYGRSKALGEIINDKDLTIRTSIIGPELKKDGEGLFHWFMTQKGTVNGFKTVIWSGITTLELAKAIECAILENWTGLVQLSNGVGISKYELLCLLKLIWGKDININPVIVNSVDKSIAKSSKIDYSIPSYSLMLEDLREWMNTKSQYYIYY